MTQPDDELAQAFDEAILKAPPAEGNGKGQPDAMETAITEAIAAGTIHPDRDIPDAVGALREWAHFVSCMSPLEREVKVSEKLAVLSALHQNAGELVRAALEEADSERRGSPERQGPFIDWPAFWLADHAEEEWVYQDVLAKGRGHAIYAMHKAGKSLLTLYVAAHIATTGKDAAVVYLDYEMTESDLRDRLDDMGYGPGTDFSRLRYALLPTLPPLDSAAGADALDALLDGVEADLPGVHLVVIIDTISRAVAGEENDADTFRAFYNHTGIRLKRRGATWVRLDHAGKSKEQGQRGSSGKGDDVDVVWKLIRTEHGIQLRRELSRMGWVPELVTFKESEAPLQFLRLVDDWPLGTAELARELDKLGIPVETPISAVQKALKAAGEGRRKNLVSAAQRWRREQTQQMSL